jgi:iron complex outermembrane receptor protein
MQIRDVLGSLDLGTIFDHIDMFESSNVVRGPPDAEHPSLPGPIHHVIVTGQNVGRMETAGFDIDQRARSPALPMGRLTAELNASYLTNSQGQLTGFPAESTLGRYGLFSPVPRWRHYASLAWERGTWHATLAQTFQTGYSDENLLPDGSPRRVGSYSVWDVQATYTGVRNMTFALGVRNLFDRDPPFSNGNGSTGWEKAYADPRGRTYYATLKYAFAPTSH